MGTACSFSSTGLRESSTSSGRGGGLEDLCQMRSEK